jgi:hypothetical protein
MKPCPICKIIPCSHERKFCGYGLAKIIIIQKSLNTTINVFSKLMAFLPTSSEIQYKLNATLEDLHKCKDRMNDVRRWCDNKLV